VVPGALYSSLLLLRHCPSADFQGRGEQIAKGKGGVDFAKVDKPTQQPGSRTAKGAAEAQDVPSAG